jgi:hypothetical protein
MMCAPFSSENWRQTTVLLSLKRNPMAVPLVKVGTFKKSSGKSFGKRLESGRLPAVSLIV